MRQRSSEESRNGDGSTRLKRSVISGDQGHGKNGIEGQQGVDINHKKDRQHSQDDRIHQEDHPQRNGHPDCLDIIGGMGHQVPYLGPGEIGRGEGLKVEKETVSECLFDPTGRSQEEIPPDIPKTTDA